MRRSWISRVFDLSKPGRFLISAGFATGIVFIVCIAVLFIGVAAAGGGRTPWAYSGVVAMVGLPLIWSIFVTIIVIALAAHTPPPKKWAERNLFLSAGTWLARLFWGTAVLVISGFVGGFVVESLDEISKRYTEAAAQGTLSSAAASESVQFSDLAYVWIEIIFAIVAFAALYVLPIWISIRLLILKKSGRMEAARKFLRVDSNRVVTGKAVQINRTVWSDHFAHWAYPALFAVVSTLVVIFVGGLASIGLEGAHVAWDAWLLSHSEPR
jgi:hypothetical protein